MSKSKIILFSILLAPAIVVGAFCTALIFGYKIGASALIDFMTNK